MNRPIRLTTGLALIVGAAACADAPSSPVTAEQPPTTVARPRAITDQYIVTFRNDVRDVPGHAKRLAAERGGKILHTYSHALKGFAVRMSAAQADALREDEYVLSVEQDILDYLDETSSGDALNAITTQTSATWGLDRIDQRDRPVDGTYRYRGTGEGVRVYIIDSGIRYSHEEFEGRATLGVDFTGVAGTPGLDCSGHGTHVAGTVAGKRWGVAKKAEIVVVRTFGCPDPVTGAGPTSPRSRTIAAVDWVTANAVLPAVANMSLGGNNEAFPGKSGLDLAVERGVEKGIVFAVAAGNDDALDACRKSPANATTAITVGSTTSSDNRSSFSNIGTCLDLFGPGSSITSADWRNDTGSRTISGTSMATPHVAGVAALYLQARPTATPAEVRDAIVNGATPNKIPSPGAGSPNLLLFSLAPGNHAPVAAFAAPSSTGEGTSFTVDAAASSDEDGDPLTYSWNFGDGTVKTGATATHKYGDNGAYVVTLTTTDVAGATATSSRTIRVTNVNPTITRLDLTLPYLNSPPAGEAFTMGVRFSDPGTNDGPFRWVVTWGDGTESTGSVAGGSFTASHVYDTPGTYSVTFRVFDKDGAGAHRTIPVVVRPGAVAAQ